MNEPMHLILYGDFNCPFSALASVRCTALEDAGIATVDWRAVEQAPRLPVLGRELIGTQRAALKEELDEVRSLYVAGEHGVLKLPPVISNTRRAALAYAAAPEAQRRALRVRLFEAIWTDGENLSDPHTLERLGAAGEDRVTAGAWQAEWLALPKPIVPTMVLPDGYVSRGLGALSRLATFATDDLGGESPCFAHLVGESEIPTHSASAS